MGEHDRDYAAIDANIPKTAVDNRLVPQRSVQSNGAFAYPVART